MSSATAPSWPSSTRGELSEESVIHASFAETHEMTAGAAPRDSDMPPGAGLRAALLRAALPALSLALMLLAIAGSTRARSAISAST